MAGVLTALWGKRTALASGATITAAAVAVSTLAILHQGVPTADLDLDDGGVWVTHRGDLLVGHLNFPSRTLDGALRTRGADFDVLQDGDSVLVVDSAGDIASPVDPAHVALIGDAQLPAGARIALGGTTAAVTADGWVWATDVASLVAMTFTEDAALLQTGADADVAVSADGQTIVFASADAEQLGAVDLSGAEPVESRTVLTGLADDAELTVTAVGSRPVAYDTVSGTAVLPGGELVEVADGAGGVLQQTGVDADAVIVSTPTALVTVPLGGGEPEAVAAVDAGAPGAPVVLGACTYAIWSGTGQYVRDCAGEADDYVAILDVSASSELVLRKNRRVVVVNDTQSGGVWVVSDEVERVDNWDDVVPPADEDGDDEESQSEEPQFQLPERSADNTPPTAVDDEYGVRAGRATIIRVTENDSDPDGDLLAASLVGTAPSGYTVEPVLSGAALQVSVPANASGTASLRYSVDDGRGGTDEAAISLTVRDASANEPPAQLTVNTVQVEAGASITYAALEGWRDPDGDDLMLVGATVEGGDEITFRSNGMLEYDAVTGQAGLAEVALEVSDGTDSATGVLRVDVRPVGTLNPIANSDRVTATAGVPVIVTPLENDLSPTGQTLRLAKVAAESGAAASVTPDYATDSFSFQAQSPGTYYVQYLVTDGAKPGNGIVRIDVVAGSGGDVLPIAARDVAYLPSGRQTLVDVLANDSDPAGGILVVQSARVPTGSSVSVEVLEHSVLRITDLTGLSTPVVLTYTVSNGPQAAIGEVLVMPVPLPATLRPPVTVDDTVVVRAGDVVSIPVLANDYHPDGDAITLLPELAETDVEGRGTIFVDGDRLRFHASATPDGSEAYATYIVEDSQQNRPAGYVRIQILPAEGANSAPSPKPVTARVVAGATVRIAVPLDGIDPDGDSVELVGVASTPARGEVTVGSGWLSYRAFAGEYGTDTFRYTVRDRFGATAQSTVTVGVAAPGFDNQAPYAVADDVSVRPGRVVAVAVMANDTDPDGDEIAIDPDGLLVPDGVEAQVIGGRVVVTAPDEAGEHTLTYTIVDTFGATAQGALLVTVDPEAPLQAPVARDDWVSALSVAGDGTVEIAVLENDEDPDGTTDALEIEVFDDGASVRGGMVTLTLADEPRVVRYALTDEDGLTGQAFVYVPGLASLLPTLTATEPLTVTAGESIEIALADHVKVRSGREPRISTADSLTTSTGAGTASVVDERTLGYAAAEAYGNDAIGVLVTDGTGPDDPEGLSAFVVIPVQVLPAQNQRPSLRNASVSLAPGEGEVTLNLGKLATDPNFDDVLSFSLGEVPAGFRASLSGDVLTVSADASVEAASVHTLPIRVTDGETEPVEGSVTLTVVVSERPFPVANDDVIVRAHQGQTQSVDVLANDFNPFEDRGPLTIVSASLETGSGDAMVAGDRVEVTPADDFFGTMIVSYRIGDATESVERQVTGRILLTVQGRPATPGVPSITSIQDRTVVLSWSPPANNGAAITGYTVTSNRGYTKDCAATTCTLDGLTNDVEYTFQVVATNEVGDSDPSAASAVARPDARPDTPAPPALVFGDKSLQVSWQTPRSNGSPVLSYNLEISPAPASGSLQKTGVTGTSLTWEGLENGVAYQVRVQAVNRAPEPSEWSAYSATMIPAGVPDAPGQPVTSPSTPVGSQAQIAVSWAAPASDNGDAVADYTLTVKQGGSVVNTVVTSATSQNVVVATSETDYTFSVTARNKAGSSAPSGDSAPRRGANAPGAPTAVTATPGDRSVSVAFTPGALNGNRASEITYHYRVNQTGATGTFASGGGSIGGLNNGTSYTVSVWATSSVQGVSPGPETMSNAAVPFGKPIITHISTERLDGAVRFRWNVNANGSVLTASSHGLDGSGNGTVTISGLAPSQSTTLNVSYSNAAGTSTASWSGQANDPPPMRTWISKGETATNTGCASVCNYIVVNTENFPAGNYRFTCRRNGEAFWTSSSTKYFPANGAVNTGCYFGYTDSSRVSVEIIGVVITPELVW